MNIISPINQLGYGVTGLNIVKELRKKRAVSLWPIGQPQVTNKQDSEIVQDSIRNAHFFDSTDPCIRIWHQHDMAQFVGNGTKIGFPIFELDTFSALEKHHLNSVDRLFVCSQWAKEVCLINGIKPRKASLHDDAINVIPLGVDTEIFKPCDPKHGATIFFNCGKWEIRKGHDVLIEIFNRAFTDDDNVELWMMCSNPFLSEKEDQEWKKKYAYSDIGHKVKFINRVDTQHEVYNIMAQVDCGIFPSKAEGWNLEPLELMACGKHVIITNYSAHTEFCNTQNSYLIDIEELEPAYDAKWFNGKVGSWAHIGQNQIDQAISHMRTIHNLKKENALDKNMEGISTSKKFTWENTAKEILNNVQ
jgi:glycosyltransferase involved in cell wall biosynthesis